jgi:hypothetical protein
LTHSHRTCTEAGCPPLTAAPVVYHCSGCHVTFGSLDLFDRHQHWAGRPLELTCDDPAELGLEQDHHGTWHTPAEAARRARLAAAERPAHGSPPAAEPLTGPPRHEEAKPPPGPS